MKRIVVVYSRYYDKYEESYVYEIDQTFVIDSDTNDSDVMKLFGKSGDEFVRIFPYAEGKIKFEIETVG